MEQVFRDKIMPTEWFWCMINNLKNFNDKPDFILALINKVKRIKDHKIISTFDNVLECIERYYRENKKFPDFEWLSLNFEGSARMQKKDSPFSMSIYESLDKYLEQEYIRQEATEKITSKDNLVVDDLRELTRKLSKFTDFTGDVQKDTKQSIISTYDNYEAEFSGIRTHIKPLDNLVGVLGYKSLAVFAAPSGNGKSTFAMSVAYYAAMHGKYVIYLSFEVSKELVLFNMVSMESEGTDKPLKSSAIKEKTLTEEEKVWFREHAENMLNRIGRNDGYIEIVDQTTASIDTYEGLCAKIESLAEERKRPADLIIVDNIDNFQILKSSERDESTKINNYIISLDAYSKKHYNGAGTTFLLLSQVNRPALKRLNATQSEKGNDKKLKVDVTCVQKYNALYEKATVVLIGYSDEVMRASKTMNVYAVKLRNRGVPVEPVKLRVEYAYSKVIGEFPMDKLDTEKKKEVVNDFILNASKEDLAELEGLEDI